MSEVIQLELDPSRRTILDDFGIRLVSIPNSLPTDRAIAYSDVRTVSKAARLSPGALAWSIPASAAFAGGAAWAFVQQQTTIGIALLASMVLLGDGPLILSLLLNQDLTIFPAEGPPLRIPLDRNSPLTRHFVLTLRDRLPANRVQWLCGE